MRQVLRKEKKYLMDIAQASQLEARLGAVLQPDPHNGACGYPVRSLYFDTPHERDFTEKLWGTDVRRKVRLRVYSPQADFAMLELKQKQGEHQLKRGLRIRRADALALIDGRLDVLLGYEEPFAAEMHALMSINAYRPKTIVEYNRRAFIAKENKTRITLDGNIRATEFNNGLFSEQLCMYPVFDPFNLILEVKYDGFLLSYIRELLNMADKSEISASKYCLARSICMGYQF